MYTVGFRESRRMAFNPSDSEGSQLKSIAISTHGHAPDSIGTSFVSSRG